jgi:uncharacterized protein YndB with AHSA1/START domain
MIEITVTARSAAPAERVFALLAGAGSWTEWASYDEAQVETGSGVSEVRTFRSKDVATRERVIALEPSKRLAYELLAALPVVDYTAEVMLEAADGRGTDIRWRTSFKPAIPGTGRLVQRRLEHFLAEIAAGLARAAAAGVAGAETKHRGREAAAL